MVISLPSYLFYFPAYIHLFPIYAFCNLDDVTWDTKKKPSKYVMDKLIFLFKWGAINITVVLIYIPMK